MIEANRSSNNYLDLRGIPCPSNFIRSSLAIEELNANESLIIDLDKGEPYQMVFEGLSNAGHTVKTLLNDEKFVKLLVVCCGK